MLFKIAVGNQIRMLNCEEFTLDILNHHIRKSFPQLKQFTLYYIDEDGDQIMLQTPEDISVYLETKGKSPKIHVRQIQEDKQVFDFTSQILCKPSEKQVQPKKEQKQEKPILQREDKTQVLNIEEKKEEPSVEEQEKQGNKSIFKEIKCQDPRNYQQIPQKVSQKQEKQRLDRLSVLISNREKNIETKLVFETEQERQIVVISLLESLFGVGVPNIYQQFARMTSQKTEQRVVESYLKYIQLRQFEGESFDILRWVKRSYYILKQQLKRGMIFH